VGQSFFRVDLVILLGVFTITNVSPTEDGEASKVKVKVRLNIHGIFFVKDATMVEKQKQEPVAEVPEAMETDPVTNDVQLPEVEKMADKAEDSNATDGGETAPGPEEKMNDDPAPAEEEKNSEGSATDLNEANGKEEEKTGAANQKDKVLLLTVKPLMLVCRYI